MSSEDRACEGSIALRVAAAGGVSRIHLYYTEYSSSALALSAWRIDCSEYRLCRIHEEVLSSARGIPCVVKIVEV